jgi:TPR repeat protein
MTGPRMIAGIALLAMLWSSSAVPAGFESGCAAWERGDFGRALAEWQPLAEQGHAQAQFRLGCLYTFGQGVPEDHEEAVRLYRMAAEQGDADAQNNLAGMYAEGLGVPADPVTAYMWLEIAARSGHVVAARNRDFLGQRMTADDIARAEAEAGAWLAEHR